MDQATCIIEGCERDIRVIKRGLCAMHYSRWQKTGDVGPAESLADRPAPGEVRICSIEGCDAQYKSKGLCGKHYEAQRSGAGELCTVEGCNALRRTRGMCPKHYQRWRIAGTTGPVGDLYVSNNGKTCDGPDCYRKATRKGLCSTHYSMVRLGGPLRPVDETIGEVRRMSPEERMAHYTAPPNENGCRLWTGWLNNGYGQVGVRGETRLVHRLVLEMSGVDVPPQMHVHHKCAVRACVEPTHLQVVHPWENSAEMWERNYYLRRIGELEAALGSLDSAHPLLQQ